MDAAIGHRGFSDRTLGAEGAPVAFLPEQFRLPVLGRSCRKGNSSKGLRVGTVVHGSAVPGSRLGFRPDGLVRHPHPWPSGCGTDSRKGLSAAGQGPPPELQRAGLPEAGEAVPQTSPHRTRQRDSNVVASHLLAVPGASLQRTGCFLKFPWHFGSLVLLGGRNCLLYCVNRTEDLSGLAGEPEEGQAQRPLSPALCLGPCCLFALPGAPSLGGEL